MMRNVAEKSLREKTHLVFSNPPFFPSKIVSHFPSFSHIVGKYVW